jgi:hypothetical protein
MGLHIRSEVEEELKVEADRISQRYGGAPVIVIVGGVTADPRLDRTMSASANTSRLRDMLGLLQTAIQIESWKHFQP